MDNAQLRVMKKKKNKKTLRLKKRIKIFGTIGNDVHDM